MSGAPPSPPEQGAPVEEPEESEEVAPSSAGRGDGGILAASMRRRVAPAVLLAGLGLALALLLRTWPRETDLTLRIEGARGEVERVELRVVSPGDGEEHAAADWSFGRGQAPPALRRQVRVPAGLWVVRVDAEGRGLPRQRVERRVELSGEPVSVPVRVGE